MFLLASLHIGCGNSDDSGDSNAPLTDGSAGVGGTGGTQSSGGAPSSGGTAGRGGAAGSGGTPSTGATSGAGGDGGSSPEAGPVEAAADASDSGGGDGSIDCSTVGCSMPPLCSSGCGAPCGCCSCGEGQVQGEYVCRGGCWAPRDDGGAASCDTDPDCPSGYWCRPTETGGNECVPFTPEGEWCGGFTPIWGQSRCSPELICTDTPPFIADAPGRCRQPCTGNGDCAASSYCAPNNDVCRDDGACLGHSDCDAAGNDYNHMGCPGYGTCTSGTCSWTCGDAGCRDLTGVNFGPCLMILGWGVQGGACVNISGCGDQGYTFFATEGECRSTCGL